MVTLGEQRVATEAYSKYQEPNRYGDRGALWVFSDCSQE